MGCLVCRHSLKVRLLPQTKAGRHIKLKSHWNPLRGKIKTNYEVYEVSYITGQANSKHLPLSFIPSVKVISVMRSKLGLFLTYGCALIQTGGGGVRMGVCGEGGQALGCYSVLSAAFDCSL